MYLSRYVQAAPDLKSKVKVGVDVVQRDPWFPLGLKKGHP